ncbi:endonuclease Q family protein, partial [Candidatus Woesearchaeota archaeon]|nr:endonuclease Q family protein [Candidatus Woesearchaeota archaeon]
ARIKGLNLLGTGDFTHPEWIKELKANLSETVSGSGIYSTKTGQNFLLSTELSLMYSQGGKGRKVHLVILAKNFDVVSQITEALKKKGRVDYDGRPIFGIPCVDFVEMMMSIDKDIEIIPAHAWTPWFGVFGSKSGFDSLEECFQDKTKYIHAIETGMSSDPEMNWRLSKLDKVNLVSFSDSHSYWPWRIGREATVFDCSMNYTEIVNAIRTRDGLKMTIETDPGYGIYHFTGHRNCHICIPPSEALKMNNICPKCGKPFTVGVLQRVEELADRPEGFVPKNAVPFKTLIPLSEIISLVTGTGIATKKTWGMYNKLLKEFKTEMNILLNADKEKLSFVVGEKLSDLIMKNREGKIKVNPGCDGVYGKPVLD